MNATIMTTKNTNKSWLDNSTHTYSSRRDADDSAQSDCNLPILSQMAIPGEVGIPRYLQKFGQGTRPRVCVCVCVFVCVCVCN